MNKVTILGIDIAKNIFQLHGIDKNGKTMFSKSLKREALIKTIANTPKCTIAMEACSSASYWARQFQKFGHQVKLISPQFVKPFVQTNKNDANDAKAIAEAASRPNMKFVPIKGLEQQDIQCIHRIRDRLIKQRTGLSNQIRGLLGEYGEIIPKSITRLKKGLPPILEDAENELTPIARQLCLELYEELLLLEERIKIYDKKIHSVFKLNSNCQKISEVEGVGMITATAIIMVLNDPKLFKNGRHFAAFLGLVPRQHSSGGKQKLRHGSNQGTTSPAPISPNITRNDPTAHGKWWRFRL